MINVSNSNLLQIFLPSISFVRLRFTRLFQRKTSCFRKLMPRGVKRPGLSSTTKQHQAWMWFQRWKWFSSSLRFTVEQIFAKIARAQSTWKLLNTERNQQSPRKCDRRATTSGLLSPSASRITRQVLQFHKLSQTVDFVAIAREETLCWQHRNNPLSYK